MQLQREALETRYNEIQNEMRKTAERLKVLEGHLGENVFLMNKLATTEVTTKKKEASNETKKVSKGNTKANPKAKSKPATSKVAK